MYIVNKDGTENEIVKAYDEYSEEYGYSILCDCCEEIIAFLPECVFLDLADEGQFEVVCDEVEDEDKCDCEVCQYEKIHSDIVDELKHLKEDMIAYRECGDYDDYEKIVNAYVRLYHIAFEDSEL